MTGVHHGYRRIVLVSGSHAQPLAEAFRFVLDAFTPVAESWLSWIDPGGFIVPHRDAGPWHERWQVPIRAAGRFHEDRTHIPADGEAFPVRHWEPHAVVNDTERPRIHLVIDRDVWLTHSAEPFALFPIPPDIAALVERTLHGPTA